MDDVRNEGAWDEILRNRDFMKCPDIESGQAKSDQSKRLPQPPLEKEARGEITELPPFGDVLTRPSYEEALDTRRSIRKYSDAGMSGAQLAFLLWSAQGAQAVRANGYATFRPVPSGGARHPFETYIAARDVEGLEPGVYRYLPLAHVGEKRAALERVGGLPDYRERISRMLLGQTWAADAQAVLFFSCVAYRAEWRYNVFAHRVVLIDLGHVGQNVMLSAAALGLGSCCMAAYDQQACDEALGLDGTEEYTVYAVAVGAV